MDHSQLRFDRTASAALLDQVRPGGVLHSLVARRAAAPLLLDVQFRRVVKGRATHVSLYAGLTSILRVHESNGRFRLDSHPTYQAIGRFQPSWSDWMDTNELAAIWPLADVFIDSILSDETVLPRLTSREGVVQAALGCGSDPSFRLIQREAAPAFPNDAVKGQIMNELIGPIHAAMVQAERLEPWWPSVRNHGVLPMGGTEADALAVDDDGRLLVIEAKPSNALEGITWAPAQVLVYARLFQAVVAGHSAVRQLNAMANDRVVCGLARDGTPVVETVTVVPVVAIGAGPQSPVALDRLAAVYLALASLWDQSGLAPLEVWMLNDVGGIAQRWLPAESGPPVLSSPTVNVGVARVGRFASVARAVSAEWKRTSTALSVGARPAAPYRGAGKPFEFCLPLDHADENLLPEARAVAIERFAAAGIPWHHGTPAGPSNHLLSSQVQCANALAPFVNDPDGLRQMFGEALPVAQVLPFEAETASTFDRHDHVVFEWNGASDYLFERGGTAGTRGANSTSVDAAIRYRTEQGTTEIALIEWKYTEQYHGHRLGGGEASMAVRRLRYRHLFDDPDGPVRNEVVPYDALFTEPLYQLMRQQFLAWRMEQAHELGAEKVRVLVVAPALNRELSTSYDTALLTALDLPENSTVHEVWKRMLRRPDRFAWLDSGQLVAEQSPTSAEFKRRYQHLAVPTGGDDVLTTPSADEIRSAATSAAMVLARLSGEGGVLAQLADLDDQTIERCNPALLRLLHDRLGSSTEDASRLRAEEINRVLHE